MEFREFLALAQKNQRKNDKEVKKIDEVTKSRKLERTREYKNVQKVKHLDSKQLKAKYTQKVSVSENSQCTVLPKAPILKSISTNEDVKPVKKEEPSDQSRVNAANLSTDYSGPKLSSKSAKTEKTKISISFNEMLELAKMNVQDQSMKKQAFDDLIPCKPATKYRPPNTCLDKKKKSDNIHPIPTGTPIKKQLGQTACKSVRRNIDQPNYTSEFPAPPLKVPKKSFTLEKSSKLSNGTISKPLLHLKSEKCPSQSHNEISTHDSPVEAVVSQKSVTRSQSSVNGKADRFCDPKFPPKSSTKSSIQLPGPPDKPKSNHTEKVFPTDRFSEIRNGGPVRGIAAQLGVHQRRVGEYSEPSDDEDDYESDDSFIDDSDVVQSKEYARIVRDVHRAMKFDPRKYDDVNPYDDLRSMEANYRDIQKEEQRSARLAAQEDQRELERDLERKRQKMNRY